MCLSVPYGKDYWELSYYPTDKKEMKTIQIERGEADQSHGSDDISYKVIDKVAELEQKLEYYEKRVAQLMNEKK